MPELTVNICGQSTTIACAPEDERRLSHLLGLVGQRAEAARAIVGDNDRWRQLLFAAIFLADELDSDENSASNGTAAGASQDDPVAAARLSALASRIDAALDRLDAAMLGP